MYLLIKRLDSTLMTVHNINEGGLSTLDESTIVLEEPNVELDAFHASLFKEDRSFWGHFRRTVELRKMQATNDNLVEITLRSI